MPDNAATDPASDSAPPPPPPPSDRKRRRRRRRFWASLVLLVVIFGTVVAARTQWVAEEVARFLRAKVRERTGLELRYDRVEVTGQVDPDGGFERVFAYTGKPGHHSPEPPPGAVVIAAYVRRVEAAFAELGTEQARRYAETTAPPPAEVIEAVLVRDEIPPGNPREW